jgi:exopolyphosphatase/guanosine-5'-triphosphate,3'-diphosphate pyrophosphatase
MEACGVRSVTICPWSTREGLLLEALGATAPDRGEHAA